VLTLYYNFASTKNTSVLGFVVSAFQATKGGIAVDEGEVNTGGLMVKMRDESVVPGCILGAYQISGRAELLNGAEWG
jgi:hypothetical protein